MLNDVLNDKRCFKLVCGAGNEDATEVEKLVTLYSKAGCNFFDLCAKPEIVTAAKHGIERSGITKDRYLCCSVGIKGDPHVSKAFINQDLCVKCGKCEKVCLEHSIAENPISYKVKRIKCIGCGNCVNICPKKAITLESEYTDLKKVLPPIIDMGIDCVELHIIGDNEAEIDEKWNDINNIYDGMLSICIDRLKLGNSAIIKRLNKMLKNREPYTTIIQADGAPMSGASDDYKTTLQAVATGEIIQNENLPVYMLLSGGTNSKTTELAKLCGVCANGVAIGTYARKIVREYIANDNFLQDTKTFDKALKIAKNLVDTSLKNLE